jgi:hypothetical protein
MTFHCQMSLGKRTYLVRKMWIDLFQVKRFMKLIKLKMNQPLASELKNLRRIQRQLICCRL